MNPALKNQEPGGYSGGSKADAQIVFPRTSIRVLFDAAKATLRRARCTTADREWARSAMLPGEYELWARLGDYDQSHAVHSARNLERNLANTPESGNSIWITAALLHDVGKLAATLTLPERVVGTIIGKYAKTSMARRWKAQSGGIRHRIGTFLLHGEVGADMIREAGGREIVALWCKAHQELEFPRDFPIPPRVVAALSDAE